MQSTPMFFKQRRWLIASACLALVSPFVHAQEDAPKPTPFVVVHSPGPKWKAGVPAFEQSGLELHVAHYSKLLKQGKLLMGGPFLDRTSGGMMIAQPGTTEQELRAFAAEDPAVKSGLLNFKVRPWLAALHN